MCARLQASAIDAHRCLQLSLDMDIFRILSRGAALKRSSNSDPGVKSESQNATKDKQNSLLRQVEKETDFFNTRKHTEVTKDIEDEAQDEAVPPPKIATEEDAAKLRKQNKVNVSGTDIPLPIGSFEDLIARCNLNRKLLANLIASGYSEPTAIQCEAIPASAEGRDLIACAPTGSGKTLAYLIPMAQALISSPKTKNYGIRGVVIAPTNELATQIYQTLAPMCRGSNLNVTLLSKQVASKISSSIISANKFDVLICTPLRLIDLVKKEQVDLSKVEHLVIDEADKLFDHGFVEQTDEILSHCTLPTRRTSMFSATIPSGVEEMANSIMKDQIRIIVGHKEGASTSIDQKLVFTGNEEGKLLAIRQMVQQGEFKPPIIIFLQSIPRAKALFHELIYDKLNVEVIHAERTPKQREEAIRRFKNGDAWVLITTDVLARGVDFKGVNLVINYDVPQTSQAYVHRIGRTGRGGKEGKAVTFFTKEDKLAIKPVLNVMKQSGCHEGYSEWMESMEKLTKKEKQQIKQHEIKRKKISTVPQVVSKKRKQRKEMIEASKRRKEETK